MPSNRRFAWKQTYFIYSNFLTVRSRFDLGVRIQVKGQYRPKYIKLHIKRFAITKRVHWCKQFRPSCIRNKNWVRPTLTSFVFTEQRKRTRSLEWPDLRSRILGNRDIQYEVTITKVNPWKFQDYRRKTVAMVMHRNPGTVWPAKKSARWTLPLPCDLTLRVRRLKFLHNVCYWIVGRYWKNRGAARRRF